MCDFCAYENIILFVKWNHRCESGSAGYSRPSCTNTKERRSLDASNYTKKFRRVIFYYFFEESLFKFLNFCLTFLCSEYSYAVAFVNRRTDGAPYPISFNLKEMGLNSQRGYDVVVSIVFNCQIIEITLNNKNVWIFVFSKF